MQETILANKGSGVYQEKIASFEIALRGAGVCASQGTRW
jgi:pyruvoyl-dependent arginine decarboxylase (PvlArgDC)